MATLLAVGRMLLFALLGTAQLTTDRGYATRFGGDDDMLVGGHMACTRKAMGNTDRICAHRTLPCGTVVMVQNLRTKQMATCVVADRGPYGATLPNGEIILKLKAEEEGTWRGLIDLSPPVARDIGLRGRELVTLVYESPGRAGRRAAEDKKPPRWAEQGSAEHRLGRDVRSERFQRALSQFASYPHPWRLQCRAEDRCEDPAGPLPTPLAVSWMTERDPL